jgi:hypothetical protein
MKKLLKWAGAALLGATLLATPVTAQMLVEDGEISTSGADCSTATACMDVDMRGIEGIGVYVNVAASGTFNFEASVDATSVTSGTWFAVSDDVNDDTSVTADRINYFTNPGWRRFRVRASAISGTAFIMVAEGFGSVKVGAGGAGGEVTNGGTFVVQENGAALTALQLIDNIVSVEDAVAGSGFAGIGALAVRQDVHADLAADGDFIPLTVDADGGLRVSIVAGAGSGGTSQADDADFTDGTTSGTPIGGVAESAAPSTVTEGDFGWVAITLNRAMKVTLYNSSGTELTVSQDRTEDAAEAAGFTGPAVLTVRRDTAASSAGTSGDYASLNTDGLGRLWMMDGRPCADQARVTNVVVSTAASGNVELVALNGSDVVHVCGYDLVADAAVGVQFIYGTGTACATGETDLSGVMSFAANGGIARAVTGATQFKGAAGNAMCIENSTTGGIRGSLQYVRTAAP